MLNRGALTIFGILALGIAMASVAVWYQSQMNRRCLDAWGAPNANLIRHAATVEGARLAGPDRLPPAEESLAVPGQTPLGIAARVEMSKARGLVHARHALIVDPNYDDRELPTDAAETWEYAIRFAEPEREVVLLLDPRNRRVRLCPPGVDLPLRDQTMQAVTALIERELEAAARR